MNNKKLKAIVLTDYLRMEIETDLITIRSYSGESISFNKKDMKLITVTEDRG